MLKSSKALLVFFVIYCFHMTMVNAADISKCLNGASDCSNLVRQTEGDPKIGDIYKTNITINNRMKILLPQGFWEVNNIGEYKGEPTWHAPWYFITLVNLDETAPIKSVFYNYFKNSSSWTGWDTPCDHPRLYPGINVIEHINIGRLDKCSFAFKVDESPSVQRRRALSNKWLKNEVANYSTDFINNSPRKVIIFESLTKKVNESYIRELMVIDYEKINIDANSLWSKQLKTGLDHLQANEKKFISWYINYTNMSKDVFFEKKNIDLGQVSLPFNQSIQATAPSPNNDDAQREAAQKEAAQREVAQREAAQRETAQREAAQRETAQREASQKEAVQREIAQREAAQREAAQRETAQREASQKEAVQREIAQREAAQREAAQREAAQKEAALKEEARNESRFNKKALIIGNDKYKNIAQLKNAKFDADAIGSTLKSIGYKVLIKTDLNLHEMKSAIRQFKMDVEGGDEVVIFFAGHGVQLGGSNYLLPIDIVADSEEQIRDDAIQLQRILDDMSEKKVRLTLALVDACRDNPFPKTGRAIGGRGLAPTAAATGQMIIFSAGSGQQALDRLSANDQSKNSLFTRILIKEIKSPGVRIDNVIREVRKKVVEAAKSVGHEQVPAIYDQVVGDFYFVK